ENFVSIAPPVAIGAAQVHIRQKLHLDVLETVAAACRTAPVARVEAERSDRVSAFLCDRSGSEQFADRIECTDVARRVRARRAADRRLIDEYDAGELIGTDNRFVLAGRLRRLAEMLAQRRIKNILNQGRFARSGYARHAHEALERYVDVDILQVVLASPDDAQTLL